MEPKNKNFLRYGSILLLGVAIGSALTYLLQGAGRKNENPADPAETEEKNGSEEPTEDPEFDNPV